MSKSTTSKTSEISKIENSELSDFCPGGGTLSDASNIHDLDCSINVPPAQSNNRWDTAKNYNLSSSSKSRSQTDHSKTSNQSSSSKSSNQNQNEIKQQTQKRDAPPLITKRIDKMSKIETKQTQVIYDQIVPKGYRDKFKQNREYIERNLNLDPNRNNPQEQSSSSKDEHNKINENYPNINHIIPHNAEYQQVIDQFKNNRNFVFRNIQINEYIPTSSKSSLPKISQSTQTDPRTESFSLSQTNAFRDDKRVTYSDTLNDVINETFSAHDSPLRLQDTFPFSVSKESSNKAPLALSESLSSKKSQTRVVKKQLDSKIAELERDFYLMDTRDEKFEWTLDNLLDKKLKAQFRKILLTEVGNSNLPFEIKNKMCEFNFQSEYHTVNNLIKYMFDLKKQSIDIREEFIEFKMSLIIKWLCLILREMHFSYLIFKIYKFLDELLKFLTHIGYRKFLEPSRSENRALIGLLLFKFSTQNNVIIKYTHYLLQEYLSRVCGNNLDDLFDILVGSFEYLEPFDSLKMEIIQEIKYFYTLPINYITKLTGIQTILSYFIDDHSSPELKEQILNFLSAFKYNPEYKMYDNFEYVFIHENYKYYNFNQIIESYHSEASNRRRMVDFIKYPIIYREISDMNDRFCNDFDKLMINFSNFVDYVNERFKFEPTISIERAQSKHVVLDCILNLYRLNFFIQRVDKNVFLYIHVNQIITNSMAILEHYSKSYTSQKNSNDFSIILLINKLFKIVFKDNNKIHEALRLNVFNRMMSTLLNNERRERERGCYLRFESFFEILLSNISTSYLFLVTISDFIYDRLVRRDLDLNGVYDLIYKYWAKLEYMEKYVDVFTFLDQREYENLKFKLEKCIELCKPFKSSVRKDLEKQFVSLIECIRIFLPD